jgi:hypothetical protein
MLSTSRRAGSGSYFPDGLDTAAIDALIAAADRSAVTAPEPTSALLDGSAAERRRRRIQRRALTSAVRALPVRRANTHCPTRIEDVAS